ncbi:MAG: D-alanine--D-alanine ligase family protein [Clostridia bacterium]
MKIDIAIIFGSMSSEHEVSCISAASILQNIDMEKYNVDKIGIDKDGIWYVYTGDLLNIKENKWMSDVKNKIKINDILTHLKKYRVAFPVLHGKYGEDGTIQGLFELAKINYVGCKVLGSAIAIDKTLTKKLVENTGIKVVNYIQISKAKFSKLNKQEYKDFASSVEKKLNFPLIVKPNKEGSSYGLVKVNEVSKLKEAISYSLNFDNSILIEKYIDDRKEVECAVLQDIKNDTIFVSLPGEITSANELYDFNAKYNNGKSHVDILANISNEQVEKIREYSKKIFEILNLSSLSRIDFFVQGENIYFNEVNTMPGFTNSSMYPMMLVNSGLSYSKIISQLIENEL